MGDQPQTFRMAQKSLMRFLSRRDGKNTISTDDNIEKAKQSRLLEFVQARKPEQATIGKTIRFMHYEPGHPDGDAAAYWIQGKLKSRLDTMKKARASNFSHNRFEVEELEVISCWGTLGTIPETITVNLSKSTVWSLGSIVTIATAKNEVLAFKEDESCVTKEHIITTGVGDSRISLEEDTEEDGTSLSEGGSKKKS